MAGLKVIPRNVMRALVAVIEPENFVLPLLAYHFSNRYPDEGLMIFDKTHKSALIHQAGRLDIVDVVGWELPEPEEEEMEYRRLWQQFYKTIAIASRDNPRCRMNFMPKRFWKHLTRFYPEQKGTTPSHRAQIMLPGHRQPEGQIINLREELEKL